MHTGPPLEDVKPCFGTFHDRPLATFRDSGDYFFNAALVHECRQCPDITPCFFISTQVRLSRDESLGRGRDQREGPGRGEGGHCPHGGRAQKHEGHSHGHPPHRHGQRKELLDVLGDLLQSLKDTRG